MSLNGFSNSNVTKKVANQKLETMGLGLEIRTRKNNYPEVLKSGSIYYQTNNITTTKRSFGMPIAISGSADNFILPATASAFQISSSSTNDNATGTGARTVYIEGLKKVNNKWLDINETLTLDGINAVLTNSTDWWRVNKMWVNTAGTGGENEGNIYISPAGQALTTGVPVINNIKSIIIGYNNSTGGFFSVGSGKKFQYVKGNFWVATNKEIRICECFYQDITGGNSPLRYEVGEYVGASTSYDYTGAAPYTEKTDIGLQIHSTQGVASAATYYVEYILTDNSYTSP